MVSVTVSLKGRPTINCDFPSKSPNNVTVREIKAAVQAKFPKMVFNRQRLTFPVEGQAKPVALVDEKKTLGEYNVGEGAKLRVKDLGPQVPYRWLYLWEYGGVIFLNPALFWLSQTSVGSIVPTWGPYQPSDLQYTVRNLIILHFLKRFYESAFMHTFSRPTVPLAYVFRNMAYYWGLVGILMPLTIYRPAYSVSGLKGSILNSQNWLLGWTVFILICEALNFYSHYHLSTLRVPAGQPRKYPTGLGFGTVVCANYWYETLGVLGMVIMTGFDIGTVIYLAGAVFFMQLWAGQKYARYKREQDPKVFPGKRHVLNPRDARAVDSEQDN